MRTLTQYKNFFNLLNEDMALSMFRKNLITFNKENILDKKVDPDELEFTKKNFPEIITAIKSVQSSDKYKKIIGSGDDYLKDKKYLPETLYKRIKSVLTRDSLIEQITAIYGGNDDARNAYVSYTIPNTDIVVFIPFTPEANKVLSHSVLTKPGQPVPGWCIASSDARRMWKYYELEQQEYPPVFIFCRKSGIGDVYDDNKYEVAFTGLSTDEVVAGNASLFADERYIEWRHPQQTEHADYWGYSNRFRKTFPEIAGEKVFDLIASLMRKYHSAYQKANTQFNKTERQSGDYKDIAFDDYLDKKAPGIDVKDAVPYAFEYIKNGGALSVYNGLGFLYNYGDYSSEFKDLLYVFINSPLLRNAIADEPSLERIGDDMFDVLRNNPELVASIIKQLPNFRTTYPNNPKFYLLAIDSGILSEQAAVDLYFNKVLATDPVFLTLIYWGSKREDKHNSQLQAFLMAINKKLPTLLPKLKKNRPTRQSIRIINSIIALCNRFNTPPASFFSISQNMQEAVDIAAKIYYQWVINSEPFELDDYGLFSVKSPNGPIIIGELSKIWLRIFEERPDFIPYNIKFIERIGKIAPSFQSAVKQLPDKVKSKNEADDEVYQVISKFKNKTITNEDLHGRIYSNGALQILEYINSNQIDLSEFKIDPEIFFGWILANSGNAEANLNAIKQFVDDNYQDIKYTPFYNKINKKEVQIFVIQYILDTFIKTGKLDAEWFNFLCELNEAGHHPMVIEITQILSDFLYGSNEQKVKKLIKKYIPNRYNWCYTAMD